MGGSIAAKKSFSISKLKSIKHSNYFEIYDEVLRPYKNKKVKVLEIGVLNGGGLFMLKGILGDKAKIVGVDLNPSCLNFKKYGFEISIGDQSDNFFWSKFFNEMGGFDIIIDDGGHTNSQQIKSLNSCIGFVKDGGIYITEDVHTSYWFEFGNPSKFSYINYTKKIIDVINSRGPRVRPKLNNLFYKSVHAVVFYQSIVCFRIDRSKSIPSNHISSNGKSFLHEDFRNNSLLIYPIIRRLNSSNAKFFIYLKLVFLYISYKMVNLKLISLFISLTSKRRVIKTSK